MKNKSVYHNILILITIFIIALSSTVEAKPNKKRTVKVGWFKSQGIHPVDADGQRYGFDYEYLQALAQYSNWDLEFVDYSWSECYDALKNGEIDIMGMVNKTDEREEIFDFASSSTANEITVLFVPHNDITHNYQDFNSFDKMTIGGIKGTHQIELLKKYALNNHFDYQLINYDSVNDATVALNAGKIDAVLSSNTDIIGEYKIIAQFSDVPFYYVVTKGNNELLNELNSAINALTTFNPNYANQIYHKHFSRSLDDEIVFTKEELSYISKNPEIYIYYEPHWQPMEYKTHHQLFVGIVPEIITIINKKSGLNIQPIDGSTRADIIKHLKQDTGNYIVAISYDYNWAKKNNVRITQPFSSASIVQVLPINHDIFKTAAVVEIDFITEQIKKLYPGVRLIYYENTEACIAAVRSGEADTTFINNFQSAYFGSDTNNQQLNFRTIDELNQEISLGISRSADPLLFSIISKSLKNISSASRQSIIYRNVEKDTPLTIASYAATYPYYFLGGVTVLLLIIFSVAVYILSFQAKSRRKLAVENARFNELIDLVSDHLYEYSYAEDLLTIKNSRSDASKKEHTFTNYCQGCLTRIKKGEKAENMIYSCLIDNNDSIKRLQIYSSDDIPTWYEITTKIIKNKEGQKIYALGKIDNIEKNIREREALLDKAQKDSMTGLLNAGEFKHQVKLNIKHGGSLLFIDVDKFKLINDLHGHYNGDRVIKHIADILSNNCNETDICGRVGGDEFAIFLPALTDSKKIKNLCKKIIDDVSKIDLTLENSKFTVSIGVSIHQENETYKDMLLKADAMLYAVKESGRNNYKIYK